MASLRTLIFGSRGLSADGLRAGFSVIRDQLASAESQRQQAEAALAELRASARAAGLASELQALENPPAPQAAPREAATVRVRCLQSFATEFQGLLVYGVPGDVIDAAGSLVLQLERGGIVARVDPRTPLAQAAVNR